MNEQEKKQFCEDLDHVAERGMEDRLTEIQAAAAATAPKVRRFPLKAITAVAAAVAVIALSFATVPLLKNAIAPAKETPIDETSPMYVDSRVAKDGIKFGEETSAVMDFAGGGEGAPAGKGSNDTPVQAGVLTAGRWSDLSHWNDWLNLLGQNEEFKQTINTWKLNAMAHRLTVTVTADGKPLAGAAVTLAEDGKAVFEAMTDNRGVANLFAVPQEQSAYRVTAARGDKTARADAVLKNGKWQDLSLTLDGAIAPVKALDLMAVIDTTGSMGDELRYLQAELIDVVKTVAKQNGNLAPRVSVNFYRDERDEYVVRPFPFTTDLAAVENQLAAQTADGGGDTPEAVEQALRDAVSGHAWREDAVKVMLLVLDAPPHQTDAIGKVLKSELDAAAAQGIRIIPVAASGVDKPTECLLRAMAAQTGGEYVFLTDSSGVGDAHIEPTIGEYEEKKLNDLLVELINDYLK